MTGYGKLNLLCMAALVAAAAIDCLVSFPGDGDAVLAVVGINLILVLVAGGISSLLISGWGRALAMISYGLLAAIFGLLFWSRGFDTQLLFAAIGVFVALTATAWVAYAIFRPLTPSVFSPSAAPFVGLWPMLIPALLGTTWYLWRAILPEQVAPQRELLAAPQYLLLGALLLGVICWGGCQAIRRGRARG